MTGFTKIICTNCGAKIYQDRKSLSLIGGIGGGIGGGLGGLIGSYTVISGNWLQCGLAFLMLLVVLMAVCRFFTLKFTHFIEVPEKAE